MATDVGDGDARDGDLVGSTSGKTDSIGVFPPKDGFGAG